LLLAPQGEEAGRALHRVQRVRDERTTTPALRAGELAPHDGNELHGIGRRGAAAGRADKDDVVPAVGGSAPSSSSAMRNAASRPAA